MTAKLISVCAPLRPRRRKRGCPKMWYFNVANGCSTVDLRSRIPASPLAWLAVAYAGAPRRASSGTPSAVHRPYSAISEHTFHKPPVGLHSTQHGLSAIAAYVSASVRRDTETYRARADR